jgi:hypothetical protein
MTSVLHTPSLWAWLLSGFEVIALAGCDLYDATLLEPLEGSSSVAAANGSQRGTQADASTVSDAGYGSAASRGQTHPIDERDASVALFHDAGRGAGSSAGAEASAGAGSAAGGGGNADSPGNADSDLDGGEPAACGDANAKLWSGNGHCYFPLTEMNTWFVNRDLCNKVGAHLATIGSASEQSFVNTLVGSASRWIGLARFGAPAFTWIDGEEMTFENWEAGAPNQTVEAAAVIRNDTWLWFDDSVKQARPALCERE